MSKARCRFSGQPLHHTFVDLGMSPLANAYLTADQLNQAEKFYPLHAYISQDTLLVQLEQFETPDHIFTDYAYFSSYSESWLKHAAHYTDLMIDRFGFNANHQVIEIASNDGYLLKNFLNKGIPVLGIEPAANIAEVAEAKGIPSITKFFGVQTAMELKVQGKQADLLIGNNVLAHVPNLNDFIAGMTILLKPSGIITMEFPHVLRLIQENQFDTIYHEHFSYFSFLTIEKIFAAHNLTLFDVDELPTHGGSLRIYAKHDQAEFPAVSDRIHQLKAKEVAFGLDKLETYIRFGEQVKETKRKLLSFMLAAKAEGKTIVGYGAPAKGNTLLNYCGIGRDFINYTVDRNPYKQQLFLPGTHIPIYAPEMIRQTQPDYLLILPWNLKEEIMEQMSFIQEWGGQFVVPIPEVKVLSSASHVLTEAIA
ncbi:MAG: class I SAM-dependent methyltransferase [Oculatellaceae cyanobacterium Prado106]|jgi:2-polyprenyl-3-methyl-5-hydroxy-6-metoxy-1,4-benzoquinol methylase|nr:class I SAM-dependent methyltransferase [Oculatellaceae cyanobacterium Prado106]